MKKVLLLHGYNGIPPVFNWLKAELEKMGYAVIMPSLPTQENLRYDIWKSELENIKKDLMGRNISVIAHSGGNPFIIKYLRENKLNIHLYIGLAGFSDVFTTPGRKDLDEAVLSIAPNQSEIEYFKKNAKLRYCVYGNDDHIVPLEVLKKHAVNLSAKHYAISGIGHMGRKSNLQKLPLVIDLIIESSNIESRSATK